MEKADVKNRIDVIRKNAESDRKKNHYQSKETPDQPKKSIGKFKGKICPFSLSSGTARPCGDWCQLFRSDKKFSCPLQEIPSISWNTRK